jgi:HTH-type transcriptional regulator / antitoxin HigA
MATTLDFTIPHVLRTEDEYDAAVQEIDALLDAGVAQGTDEWERLRFLSVLVEAYEDEQFPLEDRLAGCTPQSAVEFMMRQRGMTRADLEPLLGGKGRVSEFFAGKRPLSKAQIVALRDRLGIPADLLLEG